MTQRFVNNAEAELAAAISAAAVSLELSAGQGGFYSVVGAGVVMMATLQSTTSGVATREIVRVTARTGDTLVVTRGQEGTAARAWNAGVVVDHRLTAGALEELVSVEATARAAADSALSIAATTISNAISAEAAARAGADTTLSAAVTAASAAATSVDARVNSVNAAISSVSVLSAGGVSTHGLQSALNALSNRISAAAGGGGSVTSAEVQVTSAAVTSVNARVTSVNTALDALTVLSGGASVRGLQSVFDALSNRISAVVAGGGVSVTSAEHMSVDARVTSADAHAGTASAAATSADAHAAAASAAATSVDARVNTLSNALSAVSAMSVGVAANGLQSAINALSNTISNEASARGASVQVASAAATSVDTRLNTLSDRFVSASAQLVSIEAHAVAASAAATSADTHANTASAAATSVDGRVNSVNTFLSGLSVLSVGGVSTHGLQSVLNALSNRISAVVGGTASVTSAEHTSVDARVTSVNVFLSGLSARSVGDVSTHGLQSVFDALSGRIAAVGGGSVTSAEVQVASAAATSVDTRLTSVTSAIINASTVGSIAALSIAAAAAASVDARLTSVTSAIVNASTAGSLAAISIGVANNASLSAAIVGSFGTPQFRIVTGAQAIATATFTKVSGLSLSITGSGFYEVHGQLIWSQSGAGSASAIFGFGMSMTAQPVMAMFRMMGNTGALGAAGALSAFTQFGGNSAICATPSIMYSAKPNPGVSGSITNTMFFDGMLQASTVQSQLKVVAQCSTAAFGINIAPGSWIRAYKVG